MAEPFSSVRFAPSTEAWDGSRPLTSQQSVGRGALNRDRSRKYGGRFQHGFASYLRDSTLADVTIISPSGSEHKAHMLLLSYHSEFFKRAFSSDFREKDERKVTLGFDDPAGVWPFMLEFFYTDEIILNDDTVLPLLAMSRELMVKSIEDYCSDYAQNSLEASNAIQYLNQAVQFNCDSFRQSCVALVAEGFPSSFGKPTDGLPSEVVLEVLTHPNLVVQTEEQVLTFVLNYVPRHELPQETVRKLFEQVRFPFLSNERLASLAQEECVPKDMLLSAMATRFSLIDRPERLAAMVALAQPTPSTPVASALALPSPAAAAPRTSNFPITRQPSQHWSASGNPTTTVVDAMAAAGISLPGFGAAAAAAATGVSHGAQSHRASQAGNSTSPGSGPNSNCNNIVSNGAPVCTQTLSSGSNACANRPSNSGSTSAILPSALVGLPLPPILSLVQANGSNSGGGAGPQALPPSCMLPRKTYMCSIEYGLPGGSEYACVPLHEVWEDLVPQLHVRVSGDVVEGDAQSILRVTDSDSSWFMVSGDAGAQQPVWIEVELPPNMRVVELSKYTFSHGMNFANHMFPYGISDSAWFQMKGLFTQVSEGESEPFYTLRTSESSASSVQFEYSVSVEAGQAAPRIPPWRRMRISTSEEQSGGNVRLSVRKLRLFGRVEISLTREGPAGGKDVLASWRRRKEAAATRQQALSRKSMTAALGMGMSERT